MEVFQTIPKQWGNSLGVTIPREIVKKEHLSENSEVLIMLLKKQHKENLKKAFGTLRCDKPTQQIMDEIDEGYE